MSVGTRKRSAAKESKRLRKGGKKVQPIHIEGRKIAHSFWGKAWCEHLESLGDYSNRLPRGRTYVRNGSVFHLEIDRGVVRARVSGSRNYDVEIEIKPLTRTSWAALKKQCRGEIGSLLELLQGRFSDHVMKLMCDSKKGLFPRVREISLDCSCPDWATMCKHVAAVLYGVGARLDEQPDLLFVLRGVDHEELISIEAKDAVAGMGTKKSARRKIAGDLSSIFGIELTEKSDEPARARKKKTSPRARAVTGKTVVRLRKKFGMSTDELALLLGVSSTTVRKWEGAIGKLNMQPKSRNAWAMVSGLERDEARERIGLS